MTADLYRWGDMLSAIDMRQMTDYDLARLWVDVHDEVDMRTAAHPDLWVSLIARVERDKRKKEQ